MLEVRQEDLPIWQRDAVNETDFHCCEARRGREFIVRMNTGADPVKAEEILRKADKQRASYYNYYATGTWGDVNNYDLCVDTGTLGIEGCVDLICKCVEIREKMTEEKEKEW